MADIGSLIAGSGGVQVPKLDFSQLDPLGSYWKGLDQAYQQRNRDLFQNGVPTNTDGSVNFNSAAGQALQAGGAPAMANVLEAAKLNSMPINNPIVQRIVGQGTGGGGQPTPRGIRNNNPGNLEASPFTQGQPGFVGSDGRFAQFDTQDHGMQAADSLLQSYGNRGVATPLAIASKWAPRGDGTNDPQAYGKFIAQSLGVGVNDPLNMQDPEVRGKVRTAIAQFENGKGTFNNPPQQQEFTPRDPTYGGLTTPGLNASQTISDLRSKATALDLIQRGAGQANRDQASQLEKAVQAETEFFRKGNEARFAKADEAAGGAIADAIKAGPVAYQKVQNLAVMRDAIDRSGQSLTTGPAADYIIKSKQALANAFGWNFDGLDESQVVSKVGFGLATQVVRALTARPTQMEVGMALQNNPGLLLTPTGSKLMIDVVSQQARQEQDLSRLAHNRNNWSNWGEVEDKYYKSHPIMSPFDRSKPLSATDVNKLSAGVQGGGQAAQSSPPANQIKPGMIVKQGGARYQIQPDGSAKVLQ